MSQEMPYIGIDFGTSRSSMSWYNPDTGRAETVRNAEGKDETPSAVYFGAGEILVGGPAEDMLEDPEKRKFVVRSIKRDMVNSPRLALPGRRVTAIEVAAKILGKLRRDAEELHFHRPVRHAVITVPAAFDELQLDKIREAAQQAGFEEVALLAEPVAAALAYAQAGLRVGNHVLVYDLGGGTFDLALLAREDDGTFRVALEPKGLARCGGDDFDRALYDHCDEVAEATLGRGITLSGELEPNFLRQCRQRKETLTSAERAGFNAYLQAEDGSVQFTHMVDRATFEGLIGPSIEATVRLTRTLIDEATKASLAPDTVVLIGGSSRIPLAVRRLQEELPVQPQKWQRQDVAVALGAAVHGHILWDPAPLKEAPAPPVAPEQKAATPPIAAAAKGIPPTQSRTVSPPDKDAGGPARQSGAPGDLMKDAAGHVRNALGLSSTGGPTRDPGELVRDAAGQLRNALGLTPTAGRPVRDTTNPTPTEPAAAPNAGAPEQETAKPVRNAWGLVQTPPRAPREPVVPARPAPAAQVRPEPAVVQEPVRAEPVVAREPVPVSASVEPKTEPISARPDPAPIPVTAQAPRQQAASPRVNVPVAQASRITAAGQSATFGRRLGSYLIDWALVYVLLLVLIYASGASNAKVGSTAYDFVLLLFFLLPAFYFSWFWADSGRTIGHRILGLKVVRRDGSPLTVQVALIRYLGYLISGIPLGLGFLWMLWDPQGQTWADKIAGTEVIVTGTGR
jgi:uncharacterized RDD family membrane protein YckC